MIKVKDCMPTGVSMSVEPSYLQSTLEQGTILTKIYPITFGSVLVGM